MPACCTFSRHTDVAVVELAADVYYLAQLAVQPGRWTTPHPHHAPPAALPGIPARFAHTLPRTHPRLRTARRCAALRACTFFTHHATIAYRAPRRAVSRTHTSTRTPHVTTYHLAPRTFCATYTCLQTWFTFYAVLWFLYGPFSWFGLL